MPIVAVIARLRHVSIAGLVVGNAYAGAVAARADDRTGGAAHPESRAAAGLGHGRLRGAASLGCRRAIGAEAGTDARQGGRASHLVFPYPAGIAELGRTHIALPGPRNAHAGAIAAAAKIGRAHV